MEVPLLLALIAGLVWFWSDSSRAREQTLHHCQRLCKELNVQLLDQTVGLAGLSLGRGPTGRVQLRRRYGFEYSIDGNDRWRGTASLRGKHVEYIHMDHPDGAIIVKDGARLEAPHL
jgi:hypothetical protein